jgi:CBS domain-containing protein
MLSNQVKEIMSKRVLTADVGATIFDVMETMAEKNIGGIVITEKGKSGGIFTERDVLKRVMGSRMDPKKNKVQKVMTSPIHAVRQETHIIEALGNMYRRKFRHLLVRENHGEIVGMVSMRDILRLVVDLGHGLAETQTVGSVMSPGVVTADESASVHEVVDLLVKKDTGCVIVTGKGEPCGIFTERDVLKRVAVCGLDVKTTPIKKVMTPELVAMPDAALVGAVLSEMHRRGLRNMPIRDETGKLAGVVTLGDVLKYARALDVDENVRQTWKAVAEFWDSEEHYTPG